MTAPRTEPRLTTVAPRPLTRPQQALYDMVAVGIDDIEDTLARAQMLLEVRAKVEAVLGELDENIDCAVSELLDDRKAWSLTSAADALKIGRATVQDRSKRGRAYRDWYDGKR